RLANTLFKPTEIRVTGGGGKSIFWNQIKADVLQLPVTRLGREEGAAMGAALIAGKGVGLFPDLSKTATAWATPMEKIVPDTAKASLYTQRAKAYRNWGTIISNRKTQAIL